MRGKVHADGVGVGRVGREFGDGVGLQAVGFPVGGDERHVRGEVVFGVEGGGRGAGVGDCDLVGHFFLWLMGLGFGGCGGF